MPNYCPCKRCRPKNVSFSLAMKLAVKYGELRAYGPEGVKRREEEKKARLAELNKNKGK